MQPSRNTSISDCVLCTCGECDHFSQPQLCSCFPSRAISYLLQPHASFHHSSVHHPVSRRFEIISGKNIYSKKYTISKKVKLGTKKKHKLSQQEKNRGTYRSQKRRSWELRVGLWASQYLEWKGIHGGSPWFLWNQCCSTGDHSHRAPSHVDFITIGPQSFSQLPSTLSDKSTHFTSPLQKTAHLSFHRTPEGLLVYQMNHWSILWPVWMFLRAPTSRHFISSSRKFFIIYSFY